MATLTFPENKKVTSSLQRAKKGIPVDRLATQFSWGGFDFEQIARKGRAALFKKTKLLPGFRFETYEVVVVQERKAHTWPDGKTTPDHEAMPSGEQWGSQAWSLQTSKEAWDRFHQVIKKVNRG